MIIYCPECDQATDLPDSLVESGVPKIRCAGCGSRYQVLAGGTTITLSSGTTTGNLGGETGGSSAMPQSTPTPAFGGFSGPQGPNYSIPEHFAGQSSGYASSASGMSSGGAGFSYPELKAGEVFRDKWKIENEIGRGGSAVVYKALDQDAEMPVALKVVGMVGEQVDVLRKAWADEFKSRRLVADGRHLLHIESPVVEVRQNVTYVALPQELGVKTFRDWLTETKANLADRQEEGLRLFKEMCLGVEALHAAGLSHLDLKPENVLLVEDPVQGKEGVLTAKVGDFGLARAAGSLRRREGAGTPQYMSPEQVRTARDKEIGTWSDIYSLGCILFEILDGDPPFSGTAEELKQKHLEVAPPRIRGIARHLEDLIIGCLKKDRDERPTSVDHIRKGVESNPEEEAAYAEAAKANTEADWKAFLSDWGKGRYGEAVRQILEQMIAKREAEEAAEKKRKAAEEEKRKRAEAERKRQAEEEERKRREKEEQLHREAEERARMDAMKAKPGRDWIIPDLGLELIWCEPGSFMFGGVYGGQKRRCTLTEGFWLGKYVVTQGEYLKVTGEKPSHFSGSDRLPVEQVSWEDAMDFCESINEQYEESLPVGYKFSLPTEAQWEYACRAGTDTEYSFGDDESQLGHYGWFEDNSDTKTHPVGLKSANPWGFYDMHGNVSEWCLDWYEDLPERSLTDWRGPGTGSDRVLRGGCWFNGARFCRTAYRSAHSPGFRDFFLGFRLALSSIS